MTCHDCAHKLKPADAYPVYGLCPECGYDGGGDDIPDDDIAGLCPECAADLPVIVLCLSWLEDWSMGGAKP